MWIYDIFPALLTKKFINLLNEAQDGILDLNSTAETLGVCNFSSFTKPAFLFDPLESCCKLQRDYENSGS